MSETVTIVGLGLCLGLCLWAVIAIYRISKAQIQMNSRQLAALEHWIEQTSELELRVKALEQGSRASIREDIRPALSNSCEALLQVLNQDVGRFVRGDYATAQPVRDRIDALWAIPHDNPLRWKRRIIMAVRAGLSMNVQPPMDAVREAELRSMIVKMAEHLAFGMGNSVFQTAKEESNA